MACTRQERESAVSYTRELWKVAPVGKRGGGRGGGGLSKEGMGHGAWGMGHGACCAMGRGGSVGGSVLSSASVPPPQ